VIRRFLNTRTPKATHWMLNEELVGSQNVCVAVGCQATVVLALFSYYPVKPR
jgi:hypothetical protein